MQGDRDSRTRSTLLYRLRDLADQEAWTEFLERYAPRIYGWCRRYQLQEADAADVTQEVLGRLVRAMRTFEYDASRGSFRGWLKTVTNNAIRDFGQSLRRPGRGTGDSATVKNLEAIQAPDALAALTLTIEAEAERELLREAETRVQLRVKPHTWQAYHQTAVELRPAAEVAVALNMPVGEVYVAQSRVLKLLSQEVARLDHPETVEARS
jgi:RNA polymerase sigma-70 factor (ECF subfamily)